jgi:hypothetical protein
MLKTVAPMALLYAAKKIDFDNNADAVLWLRIGFGVAQALALMLSFFILTRIDSVRDQRTVEVDGQKQTIHEHDRGHLMAGLKALAITSVVMVAVHIKWGYNQPLVLTSLHGLLNFADGAQRQLVSAYVQMKPVERPFVSAPQLPSWLDSKKEEPETKKDKKEKGSAAITSKKSKKAD